MQERKRWVSQNLVGKTEREKGTFHDNTNLKNNFEAKLNNGMLVWTGVSWFIVEYSTVFCEH